MKMNEESASGDETSIEEKVEEIIEKESGWSRPIPNGIHSDKILDSPSVRRFTRNGMGNKNKIQPISERRFRRELERFEKKEMKKEMKKTTYQHRIELEDKKNESLGVLERKERVLKLNDSIDEMINETLSKNQKEVNQEVDNHEEEDLYGTKPNGEKYKTTIQQRESDKKYYQRMKKNKKQRERNKEKKRISDENRPELEKSIVEWISDKKENRLKKQRDSSRSHRKKIKEGNTMDITETIYFRLEDDGMGHLTLPSDLVNGLVNESREVNLRFTFHEDPESGSEFGRVGIGFIPRGQGSEASQDYCVGKMLVEKKIDFLTPEEEKK